ncbi:DoxX family membrane protein [Bdellovibrio sp. NC01]|uniref:DoxX family membrane protein n=1 Tax=Bdellovibrio sp. NC01 TaxID=2220073 RepID=UPI00115936C5|nr:DoxX family membrane protein [Bdellovibrio sp. NC01]QDK36367.1 acyltransferase [Bdellovibrio sp. NC01]
MKAKLPLIARILLGFVFFASGLFGLIQWFQGSPMPEGLPESLVTFNKGLEATIYFMPFLKITETLCGLMLLAGMWVPLALVVLAPILLNILFVHAFLAPSGLPLAIILGLLEVYLAFFSAPYSPTVKQLFKRK